MSFTVPPPNPLTGPLGPLAALQEGCIVGSQAGSFPTFVFIGDKLFHSAPGFMFNRQI